jgi:hypothetical protein
MADEVVIIGADGTEHVFPAGFDPRKAAGIVRGGGLKEVGKDEPDTFLGGAVKGLKDYASEGMDKFVEGAKEGPANLVKNMGHLVTSVKNLRGTDPLSVGAWMTGVNSLDDVRALPGRIQEAGHQIAQIPHNVYEDTFKAAQDPGMLTKPMGDFAAQTALTAGLAKGVTAAPRAVANVARAVESSPKLAKAVGTVAGATAGHMTHMPYAPYAGAHLGYQLGEEFIPGMAGKVANAAEKLAGGAKASLPGAASSVKVAAPEAGVATQAPTIPAVAGEAPASGLSAAERNVLARQGYDAPTISKIEAELQRKGIMQGLESGAPKPTAPTDASGRSLGGYAGPERRIASPGTAPEGVAERRLTPSTDQPMGLKPGFERADVADAARKMRAENPAIDEQAAAMRQKATETGRPGKPPRQGGEGNGGGSNGEEWVPVRQSKSHRNPMVPELQGKGTGNDVLDVVGPEKEAYEKQYGVKVTSVKKVPKSMFDQIEAQRKMREAAYRGDAEILKRLKIIEALDK